VAFAVLAFAASASARIEVVRWTHPDPSTVDQFRIFVSPGSGPFDAATATVVNAGIPVPVENAYAYALTVPDEDSIWVSVAAANGAGQGPLAPAQFRIGQAPKPAPNPNPTPTPTPTPTPNPTGPPVGTAPNVGAIRTAASPGADWSLVATGDLTGNGQDELIWRNGADLEMWLMNGSAVSARRSLRTAPSTWRLVGTGDFDGDGHDDLLWRHSKKKNYRVWFMGGAEMNRSAAVDLSSRWSVSGIADMNDDGMDDLLLFRKSKKDSKKYDHMAVTMNGEQVSGSNKLGTLRKDIRPVGLGDFDGDGHSDVLWYNGKRDNFQVWTLRDLATVGGGLVDTTGLDYIDTGDIDGDGSDDVVWQDPTDGSYWASLMNGPAEREIVLLAGEQGNFHLVEAADLDGNGQADLIFTDDQAVQVWPHLP
jgi:hypothetical protein